MAVLGMYGMVPFVCSDSVMLTFRDLKVSRQSRYASHEVFGQKPVLEFVGESADTVSFSVRLDSEYGMVPSVALVLLDKLRLQHKAQALVIGGEYFGTFVLESVGETRRFHNGWGVCTVAEADLNLLECAS